MDTEAQDRDEDVAPSVPERVMILATEALTDGDLLDELSSNLPAEGANVVLVAPAVGNNALENALGGIEGAIREARRRLERSLAELERRGIPAFGEVGASDPIAAAADALQQYPADMVLIVAGPTERARWLEGGLFEHARDALHTPVRLIAIGDDLPAARSTSSGQQRLPSFSNGDRPATGLVVTGTIVGIAIVAMLFFNLLG